MQSERSTHPARALRSRDRDSRYAAEATRRPAIRLLVSEITGHADFVRGCRLHQGTRQSGMRRTIERPCHSPAERSTTVAFASRGATGSLVQTRASTSTNRGASPCSRLLHSSSGGHLSAPAWTGARCAKQPPLRRDCFRRLPTATRRSKTWLHSGADGSPGRRAHSSSEDPEPGLLHWRDSDRPSAARCLAWGVRVAQPPASRRRGLRRAHPQLLVRGRVASDRNPRPSAWRAEGPSSRYAVCCTTALYKMRFRTPSGAPKTRKPRHLRGFLRKRLKGLEPSTFCMASRRSSQLSYSRESSRV